MDEIARNRQAICDFLNTKKGDQAANTAQKAIESAASSESLKIFAALGAAGLEQAWQQHPVKQAYEQVAPLAQSLVRQHPWLSLSAASALGALFVLNPGLRRQAWQSLQGQVPEKLKQML